MLPSVSTATIFQTAEGVNEWGAVVGSFLETTGDIRGFIWRNRQYRVFRNGRGEFFANICAKTFRVRSRRDPYPPGGRSSPSSDRMEPSLSRGALVSLEPSAAIGPRGRLPARTSCSASRSDAVLASSCPAPNVRDNSVASWRPRESSKPERRKIPERKSVRRGGEFLRVTLSQISVAREVGRR